jgi:DNA-binding transcriptional ArsR family regulator
MPAHLSGRVPSHRQLDAAAHLAALLAQPHRLHLLWLLCQHEHDVGALAHSIDAAVPAVSHHLAKLRRAGLVSAQRQGRQQIYTATHPHLITLIQQLLHHTSTDTDSTALPAAAQA